jgi:flavin reductase (DIM6/NTAB) family NADH-FMN oxidoreductase RutF
MKIQIPPFVHSYPAPAVLVGCGTLEHPNLITVSWFGTAASDPPTVSLSIRKSRHSHRLVLANNEFTVNIPRIADLEAVKYCGVRSGKECNKFAELGFIPVPCPPLNEAPMIDECFFALGCRVIQVLELGSHDMFVAEVVSAYCNEADLRPEKPDPHAEEQVVFLDGKYWRLMPAY